MSKVEMARKTQVSVELERASLMEEIYGKQNSRALWLMEGDTFTKFFNQVAKLAKEEQRH